jgi:hypothetical protein
VAKIKRFLSTAELAREAELPYSAVHKLILAKSLRPDAIDGRGPLFLEKRVAELILIHSAGSSFSIRRLFASSRI